MRETATLFKAGFFFFAVVALVYGFSTHEWATGGLEPAGTVALSLLALMALMGGMYLSSTAKRLDRDPADDPRGEHWMQEGEFGFYSPHSWWPLPLAFSTIFLFLGLRLGIWVFLIGVVIGALSLIGWTFEYFRQDMTL